MSSQASILFCLYLFYFKVFVQIIFFLFALFVCFHDKNSQLLGGLGVKYGLYLVNVNE